MNQLWLPLALVSYMAFATSNVLDKIIVGREVKQPAVISFWVASIGIFAGLLIVAGYLPLPFAGKLSFYWPGLKVLAAAIGAGLSLQLSLLCIYTALKGEEATRVISAVGATTPIFALLFSIALLGEVLRPIAYVAFGFLIAGAVTISLHRKQRFSRSFVLAIIAGMLAALQTTLIKYAYDNFDFISSFIIMNLAGVIYAVALLVALPSVRRTVLGSLHWPATRFKRASDAPPIVWVLTSSAVGGIGVLALNLAVKLGPVALVNGLRGVQYAVIFGLALVLSRRFPKLIKEELSRHTLEQKLLAIGFMAIGIIILTLEMP